MFRSDASRRTHQRVWRDSFVVGEYEAEVFRPYDRGEMAIAIDAAERFDREHKAKGARNGPIGHVGLEVYRALWRRVNFATGRCDPSLEGIMRDVRRSRRAVVQALKRLWHNGLVRWLRRFVYTGQRAIRGPQVQQATNAYELRQLPASMLALVPAGKRARYRPKAHPAPTPRQAAPRQRGKKSPAVRVWAAWGRMGAAIRDHLGRDNLAKLDALSARLRELDERESTQADQTSPSEIQSASSA